MTWRGIVGKGFSQEGFRQAASLVKFGSWRPSFVVVHNTSVPSLATYRGWRERKPPITGERWMRNLEGFYRDVQHWSAGPHLFVADDLIYMFTPLNVQGTHSPSWNATSWGVETVGEYETEVFDPKVRENLVYALAVLHSLRGLSPDTLRFHKEDPRTTHRTCPGKHISKPDLVNAVKAKLMELHPGEHKAVPAEVHEGAPPTVKQQVESAVTASAVKALDRVVGTPIHDFIPWILEDEGGYAEKATEPGGAVNKGVSFETFKAWRHQKPTFKDLKNITDSETEAIYNEVYYNAISGPKWPKWLGYTVLDAAINDGVGGAHQITCAAMQRPATSKWDELAATAHSSVGLDFVVRFHDERLKYKQHKSGWPKNGPGWTNRINRVRDRVIQKLKENA